VSGRLVSSTCGQTGVGGLLDVPQRSYAFDGSPALLPHTLGADAGCPAAAIAEWFCRSHADGPGPCRTAGRVIGWAAAQAVDMPARKWDVAGVRQVWPVRGSAWTDGSLPWTLPDTSAAAVRSAV
jgi:hypothetical protein